MFFTEKCLSCANANQMCCNICGVGRNGEREKYKQKQRTNADRIRSLSDEELAAFIDSIGGCPPSGEVDCIGFDCVECILEWLKREAK